MKITILQGAFLPVPPILGGAVEKRWFRLGKEFAAMGHEVLHLSRQHESLPGQERIDGVQHRRVRGFQQPRSLLWLKTLDLLYSSRACRQVPPDSDVVVTNTFASPLLLSGDLKKRAFVDVARMPRGQCRLYDQAGRLRANSTPVAQAILAEISHTSKHCISLIPNPLPFDPPKRVNLSEKQNRVLYCGRIHPEKGLELLVHAARLLPVDWSIDIVGPWEVSQGGGGQAYLESLKEIARASPVTFHDPVFNSDKLADYYHKAAIFAYPSIDQRGETFGLAPLEAMAWGCAPVVSDLACFRDYITHHANGLVFDHRPADAAQRLGETLLELCQNHRLRHSLATQASRVGESHHPRSIAEAFLADFEAMILGQPSAFCSSF